MEGGFQKPTGEIAQDSFFASTPRAPLSPNPEEQDQTDCGCQKTVNSGKNKRVSKYQTAMCEAERKAIHQRRQAEGPRIPSAPSPPRGDDEASEKEDDCYGSQFHLFPELVECDEYRSKTSGLVCELEIVSDMQKIQVKISRHVVADR